MTPIRDFADRVDYFCWRKRWRRNDLASRMYVSPSVLSRMLTGNPSLDSINKIADALQIPVAELFDNAPNEIEGYITIKDKTYQFKSYEELASALQTTGKTICPYIPS